MCLSYFVFLPAIEVSMIQATIRKKKQKSTLSSYHADSNKCSNFPAHSYIYAYQHPPLSIARIIFSSKARKKPLQLPLHSLSLLESILFFLSDPPPPFFKFNNIILHFYISIVHAYAIKLPIN